MQPLEFPTLVDQVPLRLLDDVQACLAQLLGPSYSIVLASSDDGEGVSHYHLAILHNRSGLSVETQGSVGPTFVEHLFALAWRMKAMVESRDLERMDTQGPIRLLTWISDLTCPPELKVQAGAFHPTKHRQLVHTTGK
ncbi:MAG: hypothetical protein QM805_10525 [Pseudomonas sp.]